MSPTSVPPAPLLWAGSTDLLTPTLPADPRCCEIPHAGRDHRNCQLQGGSGRTEAAQQSYTWWDSCGGSHCPPGIGPSESHFLCLQLEPLQGRSGPQGLSSLQPSSILPLPWQHLATGAACATALGVALAPGYQAPCTPCCPAGPASQLISPQFPGRRCCCCQLVSHSTGESGCRIPGAQKGRSQDTQRLQQRSSEANIKGGAGAAGLGTAQLRAAGNTHTCISQGRGGEGGGRTAGFPLRPVSL